MGPLQSKLGKCCHACDGWSSCLSVPVSHCKFDSRQQFGILAEQDPQERPFDLLRWLLREYNDTEMSTSALLTRRHVSFIVVDGEPTALHDHFLYCWQQQSQWLCGAVGQQQRKQKAHARLAFCTGLKVSTLDRARSLGPLSQPTFRFCSFAFV
jgi:hypothetical protein